MSNIRPVRPFLPLTLPLPARAPLARRGSRAPSVLSPVRTVHVRDLAAFTSRCRVIPCYRLTGYVDRTGYESVSACANAEYRETSRHEGERGREGGIATLSNGARERSLLDTSPSFANKQPVKRLSVRSCENEKKRERVRNVECVENFYKTIYRDDTVTEKVIGLPQVSL